MDNGIEFWKKLDSYKDVDKKTFLSEKWQVRNSIKNKYDLDIFLRKFLNRDLVNDFMFSISKNPMQIKLSPYVLSLIDWDNFRNDPVRKQFIPLLSEHKKDHPALKLDSLDETHDSPVQGIVHRYPNKILFLSNHSCPVYCRFCTRSYMVGENTEAVNKTHNVAAPTDWNNAIRYILENPLIEDVLVSGGDVYTLPAKSLLILLTRLLEIPSVKRVRIATKSLAVLPTKFLASDGWLDAIITANQLALKKRKLFSIQTHFNHANEITWITKLAIDILFSNCIRIRNQTVLMKGINDDFNSMKNLLDSLISINVEPYYVYMHDLVPGSEFFRTSLAAALELEEQIRGSVSGYLMPTFVVDLPNGGGKRNIWSFRSYDIENGISIFRSPVINNDKIYYYFDPLPEKQDLKIDYKLFYQSDIDNLTHKF